MEKNAFCMFYLAPSRNVVAPLVGKEVWGTSIQVELWPGCTCLNILLSYLDAQAFEQLPADFSTILDRHTARNAV